VKKLSVKFATTRRKTGRQEHRGSGEEERKGEERKDA